MKRFCNKMGNICAIVFLILIIAMIKEQTILKFFQVVSAFFACVFFYALSEAEDYMHRYYNLKKKFPEYLQHPEDEFIDDILNK